MLSSRVRRDDSFAAMALEPAAQARGIVSLVSDKPLRWADAGQELRGCGDVGNVAGGQKKGDRPPRRVGEGVDLRRAPTARAADGVAEGPPFAPAAERWALM